MVTVSCSPSSSLSPSTGNFQIATERHLVASRALEPNKVYSAEINERVGAVGIPIHPWTTSKDPPILPYA